MIYAGLDIHKITCQASVCTPDGTELKKGKIANTPDTIQEFFKEFDELTIAIEACANWEPVYEALEHAGHRVVLAHPLKTRMIAESKIKTDKVDAAILAHLLRTGYLPTSYIPTKNMRDLRNQVRQRITLGKYRGKFKNKICAELLRRGIRYESGGAIFTAKGRHWLRSLKIPTITTYLAILEATMKEIDTCEQALRDEGKEHKEVRLLTTIPGIGNYSALLILSEIGDIHRFSREEKLFAYAGVIPSVHQSGDHKYHGRITKQGSKYLRWILTEAVRIHLIWTKKHETETTISQFYDRVRKTKPENVAAIAASRKLLQIIYHMLKYQDEFRGYRSLPRF